MCAWPPSRVSLSKRVTSWVALSTCAAVRPDTPAPMTAAVGRAAPDPAGVSVRFGRVTEASWLMWSRVVRRGAPTGLLEDGVRWGALSILRPHRRVVVQGLSKVGEGMEIERSVTVGQPVDRVFAYLSDFTNTTEWDPGTVRTERVAGDGGVGTRYHNVSKFLGRRDGARLPRHRARARREVRAARRERDRGRQGHHDLRAHDDRHGRGAARARPSPTAPTSSSRVWPSSSPRCSRRPSRSSATRPSRACGTPWAGWGSRCTPSSVRRS